jgi:hypothetical protein
MRRLHYFAIFAVLSILSRTSGAGDAEDLVVRLLREAGTSADLSLIDDANRPAMMALLRDIATEKVTKIGTVLPNRISARIVLIRLSDPETIQRVVSEYRALYGKRRSFELAEDLERGANGAAIPYLADDFLRQDEEKAVILNEGGARIRVIPQGAFSGVTTLRIIMGSAQFPPEVRQWAKKRLIEGAYPYRRLQDDVGLWWQQNREAVSSGMYAKTRPLQKGATAPAAGAPLPPPATPVSPPDPPHSTPPAVTPAPEESPANPVVQAAAKPPVKSSRWWGWLAAGISVFMLRWLVRRRR